MKKLINLRGVLDGFRSTVSSGGSSSSSTTPKADSMGIEETIWSEHFQVAKTVRHGFPYQPTALAFDPVQNLVAIGTKSGSIRIFGQPGVDCHVRHEADCAVIQLLFLVNEGALVSVCADDQLHLWTLRQKKPEIVHSLKFQRERITYCHLPFQSKWMYIGTERGNVHVVNLESFALSGYVINWNKAIELLRKTHPGPVVHLSDNLAEPNKLLIGYCTGLVVLWDLKEKVAEFRYNSTEGLRSIAWHHEGKQFVCSHTDGSLTYWNTRSPQRPANSIMPHSKLTRDGKPEPCRPIFKVEQRTTRTGEPFVIFSGGMPYEKAGHTPTMTIMRGTSTTVLEMDHTVIDFVAVCSTPWNNDFQDPTAVIILLQHDFVVVDLLTPGYPCFENPYQMDLHESPVTACLYFADCPPDLIPAFYSVGCRQKKTGYSEKEWPIKGGDWGTATCSYSEIVVTGHADGSVKFWDSSVVTLQVLYKLKTAKFFDANKCHGSDAADFPFAIHHMQLCVESRMLCVAGVSHVILFRFSKQESTIECSTLEISILLDSSDAPDSPDLEYTTLRPKQNSSTSNRGTCAATAAACGNADKECQTCVKPKAGPRKWAAGFQPDLCCLLTLVDGDSPPPISALAANSCFGLLAFGNECGLVVVDIIQKCCVLNISTPDLYVSIDPISKAPRSRTQPDGFCQGTTTEQQSPIVDQSNEEPTAGSKSQTVALPSPSQLGASRSHGKLELSSIVEQHADVTDSTEVEKSDQFHELPPDENDRISPHHVHHATRQERRSVPTLPSHNGSMVDSGSSLDQSPDGEATSDHVTGLKHSESHRRSSAPGNKYGNKELKKLHMPLQQSNSSSALFSPKTTSLPEPLFEKMPLRGTKSNDPPDMSSNQLVTFDLQTSLNSIPSSVTDSEDVVDHGSEVPMTAPVMMAHKGDSMRLILKMNRKIRSCLKFANRLAADGTDSGAHDAESRLARTRDIRVLDLTSDDASSTPSMQKLTYAELTHIDKTDSSFCRSQSSSASSLDNIVTKESIQCLSFADTFARKSDVCSCPCLWVGTSVGSVLVIAFTVPAADLREDEAVAIFSSGAVFRLKGAVLSVTFLDCNGILIPSLGDQWKDTNRTEDSGSSKEKKPYIRQPSVSNMKVRISPTSSGNEVPTDRQFAVICSEKQARVISLPSQSCVYKVKITETSAVAKADVISVRDSVCLACFLLNGHIMTFSLPSLKPLYDEDYLPQPDVRVARTFCFSSNCHALYFCSPSELQKLTLSAEVCDSLNEMLGELFLPRDMPEAPKQGFFKNLFNIGSTTLDREELFGEANSGKASKSVAKYTSGIGQAQDSANMATSEIGRAKMLAIERGEKLGELEERTQQMRNEAEEYSRMAGQLKAKYRDKKWYQF